MFEYFVASIVLVLHILSLSYNFLLFGVVRNNSVQMSTTRYAYQMIIAEVALNATQFLCVEPGLWLGFDTVKGYLNHPISYIFVTLNQIFFNLRYYLCVLIVLHRAFIVLFQQFRHSFEAYVNVYIAVVWIYVILINTLYWFLGCKRWYDAPPHAWMTTCVDENLTSIVILRAVSSYVFTYIPHFTVIVNIAVLLWLKYYRQKHNTGSFHGKSKTGIHRLIIQPLLLGGILAIEPLCFFIEKVGSSLITLPEAPEQAKRAFGYAMTYVSLLVNFVFYFVCNSDLRGLMMTSVKRRLSSTVTEPQTRHINVRRMYDDKSTTRVS